MNKAQWPSRSTMLMLAVFLLPLWWAAVIAAPIFINANGLLDITSGLTEALKNPFALQ